MKRFGVLLASAALGAALAASGPALAFGGGHGFGGGGFHGGGFGGGGFHGAFGGGGFRGGLVTGRSVFVPGGNRFVGAPFAGRHFFVNRRFDGGHRDRVEDRFERRRDRIEGRREGRRDRIEDRREGRRDRVEDRFEDRFRHRRFFANRFDDFAFFGVPFAYDYAAYGYGNGCWRWDGSQWINICYNYGGYNNGY